MARRRRSTPPNIHESFSDIALLMLTAVGLASGKNHKDFDVFIKGLRGLPGDSLHLMVDATGSMHGASNFLIPVLRIIVIRSGKRLDALTWFSDHRAETYQGSMGAMLDQLIGDEPPSDRIIYFNIPSPVFTLPIGRDNPDTNWHYRTLAEKTGSKMLHMEFQ